MSKTIKNVPSYGRDLDAYKDAEGNPAFDGYSATGKPRKRKADTSSLERERRGLPPGSLSVSLSAEGLRRALRMKDEGDDK